MAKSPGASLLSHMAGTVQTRATCWALFGNFRRAEVSGISQAGLAQVTTTQEHGLTTGDIVTLQDVEGMTEVNDSATGTWLPYGITVVDTTNFTLDGVDSSGYGAYTSGGIARDVLAFTDHVSDLTIDGIVYQAQSAFTPDATNTSDGGAVDTSEVAGIIDSTVMVTAPAITEAKIVSGTYDLAEVRMFQVNYTDDPITQKLWLRRGWLGQFESKQDQYRAELRGMTDILSQQVLELYSPGCRYDLGSTRCTVTLSTFTVSGTVSSTVDQEEFTGSVSGTEYRYGLLTWTSGLNSGLKSEVKDSSGNIILYDAMPFTIANGDGFSLSQGCDKSLATCRDTYNNVINHGGFHYLPGQDTLMRIINVKKPVVTTG